IFYTGGNDVALTYLTELNGPSSFSDLYSFEILKVVARLQGVLATPSPQALAHMDNVALPRMRQASTLEPGIREARKFCGAAGMRCDFVLQPLLPTRKGTIGPEANLRRSIDILYPRADVAILQLYDDAMRAGESHQMHNFSSVFDGQKQAFFVDFAHLNE